MEYCERCGVVTADRTVVIRNARPNDKCRAEEVQLIAGHEGAGLVVTDHKHAANDTSVMRDLQRLSTV